MLRMEYPYQRDIRQVGAIPNVPLILDVCAKATSMGFTAIARVTEERWITCASLDHLNFGLMPGDELEVASTICHEVRACGDLIVIPDVAASATYRDHPTSRRYGFKSYISVPIIRTDGRLWGTLCAIDPTPRRIAPDQIAMFQLFTQLIARELDAQDELEASQSALASERNTARLREEFIAIIGHDLRNPLAAVTIGLRLLEREALSARGAMLLAEMQWSSLRMELILNNLRDLVLGRPGAGTRLVVPDPLPLEPVLRGIVEEIERVSEQAIELALDLPRPLRCDPVRIGQPLSNLLGHAVTQAPRTARSGWRPATPTAWCGSGSPTVAPSSRRGSRPPCFGPSRGGQHHAL